MVNFLSVSKWPRYWLTSDHYYERRGKHIKKLIFHELIKRQERMIKCRGYGLLGSWSCLFDKKGISIVEPCRTRNLNSVFFVEQFSNGFFHVQARINCFHKGGNEKLRPPSSLRYHRFPWRIRGFIIYWNSLSLDTYPITKLL